ncbi:hypothetical protein BDB01DRAFT_847415 [Pilobolus umbonatus]|nr:hypothetical protein BDB01DRAFT_847415 [Pilobolus umbonatus]
MHPQAIVNSFSGHGPFCFNFTGHNHTVLDLKHKLALVTTVSVEEQRIQSMGGRLLTDNDPLFDDHLEGPAIFNLSIRIVGGLGRRYYNNQEKKELPEYPLKRNRTDTGFTTSATDTYYHDHQNSISKGKEKETRKRKYGT